MLLITILQDDWLPGSGYKTKAVAKVNGVITNAVMLCARIIRARLVARMSPPTRGLWRMLKRPYTADGDMHKAAYSENAFLRNISPSKYGFKIKKYAATREAALVSNVCSPKASCNINFAPKTATKENIITAKIIPSAIDPANTEQIAETNKYKGA